MPGTIRRLLAFALAISFASVPLFGDDKDLLKGGGGGSPPNLFIVFGNSRTMTQTLSFTGANFSTFDGDADSPGSKLGASKRVIRQFVSDRHTTYNIGLTTFSHQPNVGAITVGGKHWVYAPLTVDFPGETWAEPIGTLAFIEGEVECRVGDLELRVAGPDLARLDAEQRAVEGDRALDVGDGERQVRSQDSHLESSFTASGLT